MQRPVKGMEQFICDILRLRVLEACHWNRTQAAFWLGISVRSLRMWVEMMRGLGYSLPDNPSGKAPLKPDKKMLAEIMNYYTQNNELEIYRADKDTNAVK